MSLSRRQFLQQGGVGLLAFTVGGCTEEMTPQAARERDVPMQVLSAPEVAAIDVLGEALAPGSAAAGLAHYVDHQLSVTSDENMLMIKYLGVPAPFTGFYQSGLAAAANAAKRLHAMDLSELTDETVNELIGKMATDDVAEWEGPPASFFYFVLRADAVDVTYGTESGFADLGIPYAAHIAPPSSWGN